MIGKRMDGFTSRIMFPSRGSQLRRLKLVGLGSDMVNSAYVNCSTEINRTSTIVRRYPDREAPTFRAKASWRASRAVTCSLETRSGRFKSYIWTLARGTVLKPPLTLGASMSPSSTGSTVTVAPSPASA